MTNYMQRISATEEFKNPVMVSFKTNLMDQFYDLVGKEMKDVGAHFFGHTLIKNHRQEGHRVSSFSTNPEWQEKYWNKYWDCDPLHRTSYTIAKIKGCAIASWKVVDPDSNCMEDRKSLCKMNDGCSFSIQYDNGVLEDFAFGWEKYDVGRVSRQKLAQLSNMITSFRTLHFKLNADMFDTLPTI
jgi:hypothetical protein